MTYPKCIPHILCENCERVLATSRVLQEAFRFRHEQYDGPGDHEVLVLHSSWLEYDSAIRSRCHFCTLLTAAAGEIPTWQKISSERSLGLLKLYVSSRDFEEVKITLQHQDLSGLVRSIEDEDEDASLYVAVRDDSHHPSLIQPRAENALYTGYTGSRAHASLTHFWLQSCRVNHARCCVGNGRFLPTRLIEVQPGEPPTACLHTTDPRDRGLLYTTLSHCWGGATEIPQLTEKTYCSFYSQIPYSNLPQNFKDAIDITLYLGLHHLWIDSLCIIQDSTDDWATEAAKMAPIYENSTCTIVAASGPNPYHGCFSTRDPLTLAPCRIFGSEKAGLYASLDGLLRQRTTSTIDIPEDWPVLERGWILQELLLSPRVIYYTDAGLLWSCKTGQANEIFPDGRGFVVGPTDDDTTDLPIFGASAQDLDRIVNTKLFHGQNSFDLLLKNDDEEQEAPLHNRRDSFDILPDNFNDDDTNERQEAQPYNSQDSFDLLPNNADNSQRAPPHNDQRSLARFHAAWFRLINSYSTRSLSFPRKDKLLALSAIAQRVQSATGYGYVAGLWDHPLVLSLLWRVCGPGVQERPKDYQAPTWSWASVNSPVRGVTPMKRWDSVAEVLDTKVETHKGDKRQTGQVFGGFVEMRGILWEMPHLTAIKENEEEEDEKDVKFTGEEEKEKDMERSDHNNSGYGSFDMYAGNMALGKLFSDVRMVELPEQACLLPLRVRSTESPSSDPAVQGIVLVYKGDCFERLGAFSIDADVVVDGIDGWERVDMVIR